MRLQVLKRESAARLILMTCVALSLPACAGRQAIVMIPPAGCSKLLPSGWSKGVEAAPVPANADDSDWIGKPLTRAIEAALIAPWANAYVAQDGQLSKANERTSAAIGIVTSCEAQVNAARPGAKP